MTQFAWNSKKNDLLKAERGVSFEDVVQQEKGNQEVSGRWIEGQAGQRRSRRE
jgi:uncharacterized DUF497 family protein